MSAVCFEKNERNSKTPIRPPARQVWPRRATATAASNSTRKSESTRARSKYAPLAWYVAAKSPAATRPATASPGLASHELPEERQHAQRSQEGHQTRSQEADTEHLGEGRGNPDEEGRIRIRHVVE